MHKLLIVALLAVFCGCGGDGGSNDGFVETDSTFYEVNDGENPDAVNADSGRDSNVVDAADVAADDAPTDLAGDADDDAGDSDIPEDIGSDTYIEQFCPYPTAIEIEAATETGRNEVFADAQPIMWDRDVTGHISGGGDIDWFAFCVGQDGIVDIHVDFADSRDAFGMYWMLFAAYTEEWMESSVSVASSQYMGPCFDDFPVNACASSIDIRMSVKASQIRYAFRMSAGADEEGFYAGYDTENPYTLRISFTPGDDLEADQPVAEGYPDYGSADTWKTAAELVLDGDGKASVETWGWYWNDIDWFKFNIPEPGWVRVVNEVDLALDGNGFTVYQNDGSLIRMGESGPEEDLGELSWFAPYNDNCVINRGETSVLGGVDYYVRSATSPASQEHSYRFTIEYGQGDPEDGQPEVGDAAVGSAETQSQAFDLGQLGASGELSASSYFWHYFDFDWYKFKAPAGTAIGAVVTVDFTASYNAKGWYSCPDNEDGIEVWMYMFDESSSEFPGIAHGYKEDVPVQTMSYTVENGKTYWILVMSREDWDQTNPYTIRVQPAPL